MGSRRRDLTLLVIASAIALAPLAHSAELSQPGVVGHEVITEVVPAGADCCLTTIPALPAVFAVCHEPGVPAWYFKLQGLALRRDASGDQAFAALVARVWDEVFPAAPADPYWAFTDILTKYNLDFGYQGGGRALVGRTLGNCHAFEVSGFGVTDWNEMGAVADNTEFVQEVDADGNPTLTFPASLFSPFSDFGDPPIEGVDYNHLVDVTYSSRLDNIEWNLRRWILADPCRLQASVLVGGRYMNIGESFYYHSESDVPVADVTNTATTQTDNSMVGVQIGAAFEFHVDPGWWIDCEIKGAAFNNRASQNTVYVNENSAYAGTYTPSREVDTSAFALDLRLTATCQVTPRLAVCGGYQALWVDGLALASENLFGPGIDLLASGPATLIDTGKVVYHGPHLGVTWVW